MLSLCSAIFFILHQFLVPILVFHRNLISINFAQNLARHTCIVQYIIKLIIYFLKLGIEEILKGKYNQYFLNIFAIISEEFFKQIVAITFVG